MTVLDAIFWVFFPAIISINTMAQWCSGNW